MEEDKTVLLEMEPIILKSIAECRERLILNYTRFGIELFEVARECSFGEDLLEDRKPVDEVIKHYLQIITENLSELHITVEHFELD